MATKMSLNVFTDYCKQCDKEVTITAHNLGTAPATCEKGHTWWEGKKYEANYYDARKAKDKVILLSRKDLSTNTYWDTLNLLGGRFEIEPK